MDDALGVRNFQAVRQLNGDVQKLGYSNRLFGDALLESLAFQQLHRNEGALFKFPDIVNRANVWVIQRRREARIALKTLDCLGITPNIAGKKLQRNLPAKTRVLRLVNDAHASACNNFEDGVVTNVPTGNWGSIRHLQRSLLLG